MSVALLEVQELASGRAQVPGPPHPAQLPRKSVESVESVVSLRLARSVTSSARSLPHFEIHALNRDALLPCLRLRRPRRDLKHVLARRERRAKLDATGGSKAIGARRWRHQ